MDAKLERFLKQIALEDIYIDKLKDAIKGLESIDDVKKYKQTSETFSDLNKYRRTLNGIKALKQAQRGNIIARGVKVAENSTDDSALEWIFSSIVEGSRQSIFKKNHHYIQ